MNKDFRERAFLPVMLPIGSLLLFAAFAFSLSRVLLAVPRSVSAMIALLVAGYILLVAGLVSARQRITSTALGVGVVLGLLGVVAAGAVAAAAGIREAAPHGEEHAATAGGEGGGEGQAPAALPPDAVVFVAEDLSYTEAPATVPAGEVTLALENDAGVTHDVTIEGTDVKVVAEAGQTTTQSVTLEPGTYTYYCSVPNHRASMEGTIEVQ